MREWYVKQLSQESGVSVQTLHYYDRINLLRPSIRLENGYRVYSERDLVRLQQIVALRFFGFPLKRIQEVISGQATLQEYLQQQMRVLQEKADRLLKARELLADLRSNAKADAPNQWQTIMKAIEVYNMTQEIDNKWLASLLAPEDLKKYAEFEAGLKDRFTSEEKETFEQGWAQLIAEINQNLDKDPRSELGQRLGKRCMELVNVLYPPEYKSIQHTVWHKGFKQSDKAIHGMTPEAVAWLDKAMDSYWRCRLYAVLDRVGKDSEDEVRKAWDAVLSDMHGKATHLNQAIVEEGLRDPRVSAEAKAWLKTLAY